MERAARVDDDWGIRQEAEFAGEQGSKVFGMRFVPLTPPSCGVVICSPILAELPKNYRREVLLSRALATRGVAVQRFHYRGAGHSDGDSSELTFDAMRDDAMAAAERLAAATGVDRVGFVGTRLGALVATGAAAAHEAAPLVLWEPVLDPARYYRDVLRARLMSELRQGVTTASSSEALLDQVEAGRSVNVLGYAVERPLYESLRGRDLPSELGRGGPRPTLLVEFNPKGELRPEYAALERRWQRRGWQVRSAVVGLEEVWWLVSDPWKPDDVVAKATPILTLTTDWLLDQLASAPVPSS